MNSEDTCKPSASPRPKSVAPPETEDDRLRVRSGRVTDRRPLAGLLYDLLRDHVPASLLEELVRDQPGGRLYVFTNGWLARYAQDLADRLVPVGEFEREFGEACRGFRRVPTYEGWRKGQGVHIRLRISMETIESLLVFKVTGACRKTIADPPFELEGFTLEKVDQEVYAYRDLAHFFEEFVVNQAFALAEAQWIKHQEED